MFTSKDLFVIVGIALLAVVIGLAIALVVCYLAVAIKNEIVEFIDTYKGERRKCKNDDDVLFSQWVKDFHDEPLNTLREYADAH